MPLWIESEKHSNTKGGFPLYIGNVRSFVQTLILNLHSVARNSRNYDQVG
jgi:hypothetical protein